jgi:type IV secretion system protein VirB4
MQRETDKQTGPLHRRVGLLAFLDDATFVSKGGQVGKVLRIDGPDGECLDGSEIDQATRSWERAVGLLDERFTLYQYMFRRRSRGLYEVDLFAVLACDPDGLAVTHWSEEKALRLHRSRIEAQRDKLAAAVRAFAEQAGFVSALGREESFLFFRRLLNFSDEKRTLIERPSRADRLDEQICDTDVEGWEDHLKADGHHVKVLTLTNAAPDESCPRMFSDLLAVDADFHVVTEWKRFKDGAAVVKKQADFMWKMRIGIVKQMANAAKSSAEAAKPEERKNKAQLENVDELDTAFADIQNRGLSVGNYSLTVVVHDEDRSKMERGATEIKTVFGKREFHLFEERHNLFRALWATVPGGSVFQRRKLKLMNTNAADYALVWKPLEGDELNQHLRAENLMVLETSERTAYGFNFHVGDVGHTEIVGQTGSGKSYFLKSALDNLRKYDPYVVAFVMGGGFEFLVKRLGGVYCGLGRNEIDRGRLPFKLNPFAGEGTDEDVEFLAEFVRLLLEQDGPALTAEQLNDLDVQVKSMFMLPAEHRRLASLMLAPDDLQPRLMRWVHGLGERHDGKSAWLFDNAEDTLKLSDFHCFDLEGMDEHPAITEALMFYLLHQVNRQVFGRAASRLKVIVIDEAWAFFRNPLFTEAMKRFLKTARKRNGIVIFATQSLDDLERCEITGVLRDSCLTKVLLANPALDRAKYKEWFGLKDREIDVVANLEPKGPMLVKKPSGSKVVRLRVGPEKHWMYADDPQANAQRAMAIQEHGERWLEALMEER